MNHEDTEADKSYPASICNASGEGTLHLWGQHREIRFDDLCGVQITVLKT